MRTIPSPLLTVSLLLLVASACMAGAWHAPAGNQEALSPELEDSPMPAEEAARTMVLPEGFKATVFACEPDVVQPIGFCFDDRGRLWVAEAYGYPVHSDKPGKDRILILEDTDADGKHDSRKVFFEGLNYITGIEWGFGGAWVMSPPYFYFIPDKNGDDIPDSKPQLLLDGFGNHANSHNLASALAWGPDGWLYGTHGRTNWSMIGKPGAPENERQRFDGGVYRYHPVRHEWEPYCDGMTNPWGIDWNDYGQAFVCNCVDPHLFEVIQGAHYEPWRNRDSSRFAYERIATIADHRHFISEHNVRDGLGTPEEDTAGGGHAHCGTMVYLGDNWPAEYRNQVFMNNIHGKRINCDLLKRQGSGYTASHGKDLMRNPDTWFMGVTLAYGPDGGVYVSDWSDTGECHSTKNTRRGTGRIYKITYGEPNRPDLNISSLLNTQLVDMQLDKNDWFVRHSRRLLQERAANGVDLKLAKIQLKAILQHNPDITRRLRALWTLHAISFFSPHSSGLDQETILVALNDKDEHVRAWGVQLSHDPYPPSERTMKRLMDMAKSESTALVRRYLASACIKLGPRHCWQMIDDLSRVKDDANDQNIPYLVWYAAEPLIYGHPTRFLALAGSSELPLVQRSVARRAMATEDFEPALNTLLEMIANGVNRTELMKGALAGLEGKRGTPAPAAWPKAFAAIAESGGSQEKMLAAKLGAAFRDADAARILRQVAIDQEAPVADRISAINALSQDPSKDLADFLMSLVSDPLTAGAAIRNLARFDVQEAAELILSQYASLDTASKQDAIQTLSSRRAWAAALLNAVEQGKGIEKSAISAFAARQIANLGDAALTDQLKRVWGEIRPSAAEKSAQIGELKRKLTPNVVQRANRIAGKKVFEKECATCHKLFGQGAAIGPELSGAQRTNLDYLLENIVDPSASISRDFQMEIIETQDGRIISGLIVEDADATLTIQTINEKIVAPKAEVAERRTSPLSMMPEGVVQKLSFEQLRDLIAFLSSPGPPNK
jgi:putative membrane-bound dehydrogenase-like protein